MLIRIDSVFKIYNPGLNEVHALDGVSLAISRGEFVAIVGSSGSGKSTLMNILGCLDTPTEGVYLLDGQDVSKFDDDRLSEIRNKEIGFIFQGFNLIPSLNAVENVELPLAYRPGGTAPTRRGGVDTGWAQKPDAPPALPDVGWSAATCCHCARNCRPAADYSRR